MPNSARIIKDLYIKKKLSSREIAQKLNVSQWTVLSRMRRNNIPRRSRSEVDSILFSKKPPSYQKKVGLTSAERRLHLAALMLYWAEGSKKGEYVVDFANSDPKMVHIFLHLLINIYRVNEKKLRFFLYCYKNQKPTKLVSYWSRALEMPKSQFTKPYIRKDFNATKTGKMPYGLLHIRYADKRLLMQIKAEIDKIQLSLTSQVDGAVKRASL